MFIDEMKRKTKNAGKRPCTASPEPVRSAANAPSAPNASPTSAAKRKSRRTPGTPRRDPPADDQADRQVDRRLHEREHDHAAELAREERRPAHRRQREPVEKAGLNVAREVGAGVHRREECALDERHREGEGDEGVPREARQVRLGLQPAGVAREQEHREEQRRNDVRRLPDRAHDRAAAEQVHLGGERSHQVGSIASSASASSSPSPAPSSKRPVLARKTSSSEGWWSWMFSACSPSASRARTMSARPR